MKCFVEVKSFVHIGKKYLYIQGSLLSTLSSIHGGYWNALPIDEGGLLYNVSGRDVKHPNQVTFPFFKKSFSFYINSIIKRRWVLLKN